MNALSIQDFALYLDAPCMAGLTPNPPRRCIISGVNTETGFVYCDGYPYKPFEVEPILRPLSSLTEVEAREICLLINGTVPSNMIGTVLDWWKTIAGNPPHWLPITAWRWLFTHQFDLFGWIEKGLAIDATQK